MNEATKSEWNQYSVYIALGSNIEPEKNLAKTVQKLRTIFDVDAVSSVWQTPAVGFDGKDFLNAVVQIRTPLSPPTLKNEVLRPLEALLGRVRTKEKFSARTIDMDILIHNEDIIDHEIWEQAHLALPLAELKPNLHKEETGETLDGVSQLLQQSAQTTLRIDLNLHQSD